MHRESRARTRPTYLVSAHEVYERVMIQMSDAWKNYRSAPPDRTLVCAADAVGDESTKSVKVESPAGQFPILLVKTNGIVRAYVNACPHQYLPLDYRGDKLLSVDRQLLRCTNHSAGFRVEDGVGAEGFGIGCSLDPVPVYTDRSGRIRIGSTNAQTACD